MDVNCFQTRLGSKPKHSIKKKSTKKSPAHVSKACFFKKALDCHSRNELFLLKYEHEKKANISRIHCHPVQLPLKAQSASPCHVRWIQTVPREFQLVWTTVLLFSPFPGPERMKKVF
jgi:hypothetical protein